MAAAYNATAADSALWTRLGGLIVIVLGFVSVLGVIVAVFAASQAGQAVIAAREGVSVQRSAGRAYLNIETRVSGGPPLIIGNVGCSPAFFVSLMFCRTVDACDPSVAAWVWHSALGDAVPAGGERRVFLPAEAAKPLDGILLGVEFVDVHGDRRLYWRQVYGDGDWPCRLGRSGEFPLGR